MAEQISFKERVRQTVIQYAKDYKSYFVLGNSTTFLEYLPFFREMIDESLIPDKT